jgi:hypothetical protein
VTPNALGEPPDDYGALAVSFPELPKERLPAILYRVHQIINEPEWFGTSGDHRWDPPAGAPESFGTCYTGTDPLTAFVEAIIELPLLVQSVIDKRAMAVMQVPQDQRLADMSDPKIVGEWGLDRRISVGDDYDVCQRWANALRLAGFTGVFYEPRHDPRGGGDLQSIAFFGDPGYQPTQIQLIEDEPIPRLVVEQAREIFGLRVWPSTPLPPHPLIEFF